MNNEFSELLLQSNINAILHPDISSPFSNSTLGDGLMNNSWEINLEMIKSKIENMSKKQHIEILKILKSNSNVTINENKSGVFINLSFLPKEIIVNINKYVNYISEQESSLNQLENQKNIMKTQLCSESI